MDSFIARYGNKFIGVNEHDASNLNFNLYPNPASEQVIITFSANGKVILDITDTLGRKVENSRLINNDFTLNINHYNKGLYFVRLTDGETTSVLKMVVR